MITFTFILICYGACNNMIYGSIFGGFRDFMAKFGTGGYSLHKLFTCWMCLGTWMGFVISALMAHMGYANLTPMGSLGLDNLYLMTFLNGLVATGGVWLLNTVQDALEEGFYRK